jgi:ADP-ribosylglycohydrolase
MKIMATRLLEKVSGWLFGAAIGDAMGAPTENFHYRDIPEVFGRVKGFVDYRGGSVGGRSPYEEYAFQWGGRKRWERDEPHPWGAWRLTAGTYTDDMRVRLLPLQSFLKRRRRFSGWEFAKDIIEFRIESQKYPAGDLRHEWAKGMWNLDEIVTICLKGPLGHTVVVGGIWGSPMGIVNACDPQAAVEDGGLVGGIVSEAMQPEATVDKVIAAALRHSRCFPNTDWEPLPTMGEAFNQRLERALKDADRSADVYELIARLYEWICVATPPFSAMNQLEAVPAALAMIYKAKGDFRQAVLGSANFGRDCDTIACVAGEICGALHGIGSIPSEWVATINRENPDPNLDDIATKVTEIIMAEARRKRQIADALLGMG